MIFGKNRQGLANLQQINQALHQSLRERLPEVAARTPLENELRTAQNKIQDALAALPAPETVLFAGIFAYFNFNKFSIALRRRGFKTVFLSLNPANALHHGAHFDCVLDAAGDLDLFYRTLSAVSFKAVHFQAWLGLHPFAQAAALLCRNPFVAEFNDLPQLFLEESEFDRVFGPGAFKRDLEGVQGIINVCDAALFNHCAAAGEMLYAGAGPPVHVLHFHSFPEENFFAQAAAPAGPPWQLVFAGTLNPSSYPPSAFGDVQLLSLLKLLLPQGLDFRLYLNPFQSDLRAFWDYQYLSHGMPRFSLRKGLAPDQLPQAMADCHFGSMLHLFPDENAIKKEHLAFILPSKFFAYLEAGLPVLVSEELQAVAELVRAHGLGLVFAQKDLTQVNARLAACDYAGLRANVRAFRGQWRMSDRIAELLDLYEKTRRHHEERKAGDLVHGSKFTVHA